MIVIGFGLYGWEF